VLTGITRAGGIRTVPEDRIVPEDMDRRLSPPVEGDADPGSAVDGGENTSEVRGAVR